MQNLTKEGFKPLIESLIETKTKMEQEGFLFQINILKKESTNSIVNNDSMLAFALNEGKEFEVFFLKESNFHVLETIDFIISQWKNNKFRTEAKIDYPFIIVNSSIQE